MFVIHIICNFSFKTLCDLKVLGFSNEKTISGILLQSPLALRHGARVSLLFMGLLPGIFFYSAAK